MKICANCKHYRMGGMDLYATCQAPQNIIGVYPVSGNPQLRTIHCSEQREARIFFRSRYCGPDAKWYEPR